MSFAKKVTIKKNLEEMRDLEINQIDVVKLVQALSDNNYHQIASLIAHTMSIYSLLKQGDPICP